MSLVSVNNLESFLPFSVWLTILRSVLKKRKKVKENIKEKLSTTGMGTHSPHSFWNGKLATKFYVELFLGGGRGGARHSLFVFVFSALINGFTGFRFPLLHLYGIENGIHILFSHVIRKRNH